VHGFKRIADRERDIVQFGFRAGRGAAQYAGDQAFAHLGSSKMEMDIMPCRRDGVFCIAHFTLLSSGRA
jgi:hypothetical protein